MDKTTCSEKALIFPLYVKQLVKRKLALIIYRMIVSGFIFRAIYKTHVRLAFIVFSFRITGGFCYCRHFMNP